ncbi:hypothetical protein [Rhizobium sp. LjRoot254]|uniref:hypothetical protein n=1 Tax=Rhizobium sp. LjRoot254 TaxID=3342297 RepID=UPI003ECC8517
MSIALALQLLNKMVEDRVISTYAIAGAVAALNYIEPTVTEDLDILVSFDAERKSGLVTLGPMVSYLANAGYQEWKNEGVLVGGWPVQFLPVSDALDMEALAEAEVIDDEFEIGTSIATRILSAEHLAAIALRTGRGKDYLRIDSFIDQDVLDLVRFKAIILRHDLKQKWLEFCRKTGRSDPIGLEVNS